MNLLVKDTVNLNFHYLNVGINPMTQEDKEPSLDNIVDALNEEQAKFILKASVITGHLPKYWLEKGIKLAKIIKKDSL